MLKRPPHRFKGNSGDVSTDDGRIMNATVQLEFRCPDCRACGLSPEMPASKAVAVSHRRSRIRCPRCSAVVEITMPLGVVMVPRVEESMSAQLCAAIEARLAKRNQKKRFTRRNAASNDLRSFYQGTLLGLGAAAGRRNRRVSPTWSS